MAIAFICDDAAHAPVCKCCKQEFQSRFRNKAFCSKQCADKLRRATTPRVRPSARRCYCKACSAGFYSVNESKKRFCSDTCKAQWSSIQRRVRFRTYVPRKRIAQDVQPKPGRQFNCVQCGVAHIVTGRERTYCSEACAKKAVRLRSVASGHKSAYRKARKLRLRCVTVENVNPLVVLERDGWTCRLCGIKTPKRLRGSFDDRAPEVDHIVPLAEGGEHSYRNVQCACRRCNIAKGATAKGQMRLFG